LERGQPAPFRPAKGLGEHCKLTECGSGRIPAAKMFSSILEAPRGLFQNLWFLSLEFRKKVLEEVPLFL